MSAFEKTYASHFTRNLRLVSFSLKFGFTKNIRCSGVCGRFAQTGLEERGQMLSRQDVQVHYLHKRGGAFSRLDIGGRA